MLDSLSTAVVELDDRGCVRDMNTAAENCLATGRERSRGGRFLDIAGIPEVLSAAISASVSEQRGRHLRECKLAGGWYDCNIQTLPEQHMLLEFSNLKWQQQQSKLQQLEVQTGMMDLLRRNLGHEIRNPLGGIRGAAQMMAEELKGRELGTLAELIMREVDRIDELMARFGQPKLEFHDLDIHLVLQETTDLLLMESGDGLSVIQDYDPSIPRISADASALRQLFLNLARNAYQAGATEIRIRSRVDYDSGLMQPGTSSCFRLGNWIHRSSRHNRSNSLDW